MPNQNAAVTWMLSATQASTTFCITQAIIGPQPCSRLNLLASACTHCCCADLKGAVICIRCKHVLKNVELLTNYIAIDHINETACEISHNSV